MVCQAIEADLAGHGLLQQLLVDGRVQPNDLFQVGVKTILFCRSSLRLSRAYLGKSLNCRFSPWGREVRSRERKKEKKKEKKDSTVLLWFRRWAMTGRIAEGMVWC